MRGAPFIVLLALLPAACAMPVTVMEDPATGRIVRCMTMPEFIDRLETPSNKPRNDESKCVSDHMGQGYKVKRREMPN